MQGLLERVEKECINRTIPLEQENLMLKSLMNLYNNNHKLEAIQAQINYNRLYLKSKLIQVSELCYKILKLEKNEEKKNFNGDFMEMIKAVSNDILELDIKSSHIDSNLLKLTDANCIKYNIAENLLAIRQCHDSKWLYDYFTTTIPIYLKNDNSIFIHFLKNKDNALFLNSLTFIEDIYTLLSKYYDTLDNCDTNKKLQENSLNGYIKILLSNVSSIAPNIDPQYPSKPSEDPIRPIASSIQEIANTRQTQIPPVKKPKSMLPKPRPSSRLTCLSRQKSMIPCKHTPPKSVPEIVPITAKEFASVPTYMKGRSKLEEVNLFVMTLGKAFSGKYQLIEKGLKPGGTSAMNKENLDLFYAYKDEMDALGGAPYVREEDISRFSGSKLDKRRLNYTTILRHLGKIREERMKGKRVCYVLQS